MFIPIAEYAQKHARKPCAIRRRCLRGTMPTAVKIGSTWWVDSEAKLIDHREYPYCYIRRFTHGDPGQLKKPEKSSNFFKNYCKKIENNE